ncbi:MULTISPECIES: 6-phosphogluconolactonase [unclassified Nocardioides]|uniref:6-phosphogluconolactonase n=1 Tax=unclassified Nocardioides TaxID=2615069 RepID=UPI0006F4F3EE|nr:MULTISPECIES: 6-phosphogluconolactonase [unclassified Nocardioides]KQY64357.1 6-phosphogluconolactonase [Nocardioides sp. Root140]KRF18128.1 6-phosphogluconolactonase [Nocardioides sp. Soil796]
MTTATKVHDDGDALAEAVAEALIQRLAEVQAEGRVPSVCLTGGTIAGLVHRKLASSLNGFDVDWDEVDFWWGDERYVDATSDDRNAVQARRDLLDHMDVDPERVHEMPSHDSGLTLDEAAQAYSDEIRAQGGGQFDVVMLGLGPDGHIASLFPGSHQIDVDDRIAVAVPDSPKPPPERISLTFGALNHTRAVWFIVSGVDKAEAVARSRGDLDLHGAPATGVTGTGEIVWWLDAAAARAVDS